MEKTNWIIWGAALPLLVLSIAVILFAPGKAKAPVELIAAEAQPSVAVSAIVPEDAAPPQIEESLTIGEDTKMVYEYYFAGDGISERVEDAAPDYLLGLTKDEVASQLPDWEVLDFGNSLVTLRKSVDGMSEQHFILSVFEDYVAVYYIEESEHSMLREITDVPLSSLSSADQERLRQGVLIDGKENLRRALEDYGS